MRISNPQLGIIYLIEDGGFFIQVKQSHRINPQSPIVKVSNWGFLGFWGFWGFWRFWGFWGLGILGIWGIGDFDDFPIGDLEYPIEDILPNLVYSSISPLKR